MFSVIAQSARLCADVVDVVYDGCVMGLAIGDQERGILFHSLSSLIPPRPSLPFYHHIPDTACKYLHGWIVGMALYEAFFAI